jgi:predicted nucleic acid-binding protein
VAEPAVVNASPLIFLSRAGLIDLLTLTGATVFIPVPVADEIRRGEPGNAAAVALDATPWLQVKPAVAIPPVIAAWDLGVGESSVLAHALQNPGAEAIIDDLAGRRCAAAIGVPVRGTLGLVLIAKRRGVIPAARSVLDHLRQTGMYLSDRVLNAALAEVGE